MKMTRKDKIAALVLVAASGLVLAGCLEVFHSNFGPRPPLDRSKIGTTPTTVSAAPPTSAGSGPSRVEAGIPLGYAHSQSGAVAASAGYLTTGQALLSMADSGVEKAVRVMAAAGSADTQVADTLTRLHTLRSTLSGASGPVTYRQAVVAARVDGYTSSRARVSLWHVGVLSAAGVAPPQAGWAISTFELVWERGDWKVWVETSRPGPAPQADTSAAPATAEQLDTALAGFRPLDES